LNELSYPSSIQPQKTIPEEKGNVSKKVESYDDSEGQIIRFK